MKAIILAANAAATILPSQLPDMGEPLLLHTLRWLSRFDVSDVALELRDQAGALREIAGDGRALGIRLEYAVEEEPRGTAGTLRQLAGFFDETCVVLYGHLLPEVDLAALYDHHAARHAIVTMGLRRTDDPETELMVECESDGKVARLVQHPAHWPSEQRTAAAGLYLMEPAVLEYIPADRTFDWEEHLLPLLVTGSAPIYGQLVDGSVLDMTSGAPGSSTR
jgi:NDP-sugar pyrophosphorylase family protein